MTDPLKLGSLGRALCFENALYLRSVYRIWTDLHGLRCHPLTCMLLNVR
jgi:hypothetical protein